MRYQWILLLVLLSFFCCQNKTIKGNLTFQEKKEVSLIIDRPDTLSSMNL